ncbi:cytochrome C oxidase subunit IV family protein [Foetidibacter luteolus]|uniref:cytochrome C oxidase subunit IV family protein n=1 Tax=Foetidibacter luteolus TaxID=2608880 RepID=UPI00129A3A60|nr:cytochrome C oxidase subunit IV family protein [Foetidibacter luteolus]
MEHTTHHSEAHHGHDTHAGGGTKEIIKVTVILTVLTIVELILGFWMIGMPENMKRHMIKATIIVLMMAKAFYIVGYFMHLKHEIKNLIMTITVPLLLFVWFIIAFLADGNSYKNLRNTYDRHHLEASKEKAKPAEHHNSHEAEEHGKEEKKPVE